MKEAMYWITCPDKPLHNGEPQVQCLLCPHVCVIPEGKRGLCRVRENEKGKLISVNYGCVTAAALDPIEKKPLNRYMPGSRIFSLGTFGCSLDCGFCQNWTIARGESPAYREYSPEELVENAQELVRHGNIGIAYTYSEPLMWYEFMLDTARLVRSAGLKNILVTNGYINPKPLKELLPYIDAVNLDVKAYTKDFYNNVCRGSLQPVLESAKLFAGQCHIEITTLLVPGLNDNTEEIENLVSFIAGLDKDIPLHFSRYFPNYKMKLPPTPLSTLEKARDIAEKKLTHVFLGNV